MARVYLFLADGFEEIEGLTVVDLLRRGKVDIETVSIMGRLQIEGSHHIRLEADRLFEEEELKDAQMYVLPGGMPGTRYLGEHEGLGRLLTWARENGKELAAICAAPSVLGGLGLLEGEQAACYPGFEDKLKGADVRYDEVVRSGRVTTSRGMGTAIPFGLSLLETLEGPELSGQIGDGIIFRKNCD